MKPLAGLWITSVRTVTGSHLAWRSSLLDVVASGWGVEYCNQMSTLIPSKPDGQGCPKKCALGVDGWHPWLVGSVGWPTIVSVEADPTVTAKMRMVTPRTRKHYLPQQFLVSGYYTHGWSHIVFEWTNDSSIETCRLHLLPLESCGRHCMEKCRCVVLGCTDVLHIVDLSSCNSSKPNRPQKFPQHDRLLASARLIGWWEDFKQQR